MPRVTVKTKSQRGAAYTCNRCGKKIEPGTKFYSWAFRYGGDRRQCEKCGPPRASQLTQSKLSDAYAAVEAAEDSVAAADEPADIAQALNDCAYSIEDVRSEYEDGLSNMPDGLREAAEGGETGERMQALEDFASSLQDAASNIEGEEFEEGTQTTREEWLEDLRQQASDALGELNV